MSSPQAHGLAGQSSDGRPVFHPLNAVDVKAYILGNSAHVTVTQTFTYLGGSDARYIFPTPANAAICGFRMQTSGRVVYARVKELEQAQEEFEEAVSNDKWAGLLEEVAADAFIMSVGAAPSGEDIVVILSYVQTLAEDTLVNQIRFGFPTHIAERYGTLPARMHGTVSSSTRAQLSIVVEVLCASPIQNIYSPSHSIRGVPDLNTKPFSVTIELDKSSQVLLDRDFVLCVQADDISKPRCTAEVDRQRNSVALSLTLVPNLGMNLIPEQEYIFVLDRSGSMSGTRIESAKAALQVLLHSLPSENTFFNILSFSSTYEQLWSFSSRYTMATLNYATRYLDSISANISGTKIANAVQAAINSRNSAMPTSVFVLTDGEIWHVDVFLASIRNLLASNGAQRSVRLFSLGIGDGASTELCEGLARVGNGLCYMTTHGEDIASKCAALLRASRVSPSGTLQNISIDWGAQESAGSSRVGLDSFTVVSSATNSYQVILPPPLSLQQAPSTVPSVYPENRFTIYAILNETLTVPKQVVVQGLTPDGGVVSLPFRVRVISPAEDQRHVTPRPLHILAARRLITELEDGDLASLGLGASDGDALFRHHVLKAAVVRLSVEYQLASRFAAFLATEEEEVGDMEDSDTDDDSLDGSKKDGDGQEEGVKEQEEEEHDESRHESRDDDDREDENDKSGDETDESHGDDSSEASFKTANTDPRSDRATRGNSASWRFEYLTILSGTDSLTHGSDRTSSHASTPIPQSPVSNTSPPALFTFASNIHAAGTGAVMFIGNALVQYVPPIQEAIEIIAMSSSSARPLPLSQIFRRSQREPRRLVQQRPPAAQDRVTGVARLQAHDGSFVLSPGLLSVLSDGAATFDARCRAAQPAGIDDILWGTALVLAYLRTRAETQRDVWEALWSKALAFAAARCAGGQTAFVLLIDQAEILFKL